MPLEKLTITPLDGNRNRLEADQVVVQFNPTEYTLEDGNTWKDQEHVQRKAGLQFIGRTLRKLALELLVDTYEDGRDVRTLTNRLAKLLIPTVKDKEGMRPPICHLDWGKTKEPSPIDWVLESLKQQFVLFRADGTPVRARLSVSFKEWMEPPKETKQNPPGQSFPAQSRTIRQGETLSGIAGALWGRPDEWRHLAAANAIDNPRLLAPGRVLAVPVVP